jgi:hypothetical protein
MWRTGNGGANPWTDASAEDVGRGAEIDAVSAGTVSAAGCKGASGAHRRGASAGCAGKARGCASKADTSAPKARPCTVIVCDRAVASSSDVQVLVARAAACEAPQARADGGRVRARRPACTRMRRTRSESHVVTAAVPGSTGRPRAPAGGGMCHGSMRAAFMPPPPRGGWQSTRPAPKGPA